jgi:hypothetical protein
MGAARWTATRRRPWAPAPSGIRRRAAARTANGERVPREPGYAASRADAAAAAASKRVRLRYAEGETSWWRRNALANCAGWR